MPNCLRLLTLAWLHALPYLLFLERKKIFQGRLFDGKKNLCIGYRPTKPMENAPARCRMTVNNINKNTSTKTLQTERETGLKLSEKPTGFLVRLSKFAKGPHLRCERATVGVQLWPFCKLVWVFSDLFSNSNPCQQNSSGWLSAFWTSCQICAFTPEWTIRCEYRKQRG